jgi:2-amino-4-hydroxy-6-hydroxymethyldihydropteridine diphosphokinase
VYYSHSYLEAARALDIDLTADREAAKYLDRFLKKEDYNRIGEIIHKRPVIIWGVGPSQEVDLQKIMDAGLSRKFISVGVDGAIYLLLRYKIHPHVLVTDLGGDATSIEATSKYGTHMVIHCHGGNIEKVRRIFPKLHGRVYGVTRSQDTDKVKNFGGFTDGDIAAHLADHFRPKFIVLAGMDYGRVMGFQAGDYDSVRKPRRMKESKKILENHIKASKTPFYNFTSGGEHIKHTTHIDVVGLRKLLNL